jgi:hypothetical protein
MDLAPSVSLGKRLPGGCCPWPNDLWLWTGLAKDLWLWHRRLWTGLANDLWRWASLDNDLWPWARCRLRGIPQDLLSGSEFSSDPEDEAVEERQLGYVDSWDVLKCNFANILHETASRALDSCVPLWIALTLQNEPRRGRRRTLHVQFGHDTIR